MGITKRICGTNISFNTGSFVTTGQTGCFLTGVETGSFVTNNQTGCFLTGFDTGSFITSGQTGIFVITGSTGSFITCDQTGDFGNSTFNGIPTFTGFPIFGPNPSDQHTAESIFSNSCYVNGSTQYSFYICSAETQGDSFDGTIGNCWACMDICLPNTSLNQAWLVKNTTIGIGEHWNGTQEQNYAAELNFVTKSSSVGQYNLTSPIYTTIAKTQPEFCFSVQNTISGLRFKICDSPNTKMKWTSKIEVIQTISEDIILDAGIENYSDPTGYIDSGI